MATPIERISSALERMAYVQEVSNGYQAGQYSSDMAKEYNVAYPDPDISRLATTGAATVADYHHGVDGYSVPIAGGSPVYSGIYDEANTSAYKSIEQANLDNLCTAYVYRMALLQSLGVELPNTHQKGHVFIPTNVDQVAVQVPYEVIVASAPVDGYSIHNLSIACAWLEEDKQAWRVFTLAGNVAEDIRVDSTLTPVDKVEVIAPILEAGNEG